jgi:hypothetical protein
MKYFILLSLLFISSIAISGINQDGVIDLTDFALLSDHWLTFGCGACRGRDLSGDGNVTIDDLMLLVDFWLWECPQ